MPLAPRSSQPRAGPKHPIFFPRRRTFITLNAMDAIKQEPVVLPEGLLPSLEIEVPQGFERDEWEELTEVITTVINNSIC
jgi:hypothetical protein